jgi:paired amphipathic helix protein Sin3a
LLNEIERIYHHDEDTEEQDKKRRKTDSKKKASTIMETMAGTLGLNFVLDDSGLFMDISLLIFSYMEHQHGFGKTDRDKVQHFIKTLIPSFFIIDSAIPSDYNGGDTEIRYSYFANNNKAINNKTTNNNIEDSSSSNSSSGNDRGSRNNNGNSASNGYDEDHDDDNDSNSLSSHSDGYSETGRRHYGQEKANGKHQKQQAPQRQSSRTSSRTKSASSFQSQAETAVNDSPDSDKDKSSQQISYPLSASTPSSPVSDMISSQSTIRDRHTSTQHQQHLMLAAAITAPRFYKRNSNCLFGNTNLYCFFRLFEVSSVVYHGAPL